MILYRLTDGDAHSGKITYHPRTCFLMTQLGMPVPSEVNDIRRDLKQVLEDHDFKLIDANSAITGRDFLLKIWDMIVTVPLAVAVVHEEMPMKTLHNVFYEIGVAQAVGKETIIIKSKGAEVPSDFVRTEYIEYDRDFAEKAGKYFEALFARVEYYEFMAELLQQNPLLAIDYLRRAFLISGRTEFSEQAQQVLNTLNLEGRARNSVEMLLADF